MSGNLIMLSAPKITSALHSSMPELSGGAHGEGLGAERWGKGGISAGGRARHAWARTAEVAVCPEQGWVRLAGSLGRAGCCWQPLGAVGAGLGDAGRPWVLWSRAG